MEERSKFELVVFGEYEDKGFEQAVKIIKNILLLIVIIAVVCKVF